MNVVLKELFKRRQTGQQIKDDNKKAAGENPAARVVVATNSA
jgi:hypothetical protein